MPLKRPHRSPRDKSNRSSLSPPHETDPPFKDEPEPELSYGQLAGDEPGAGSLPGEQFGGRDSRWARSARDYGYTASDWGQGAVASGKGYGRLGTPKKSTRNKA